MATQDHLLITCAGCQHEFRVVAALVGKQLACPHCSRALTVRGDGPTVADQLIGRKVGGCRLTRRLGAGALGLVYQAEDLDHGRSVAVKLLGAKAAADPTVAKRFMREARLCAQIDHPNVVRVYDCGFDRGVNYLVMELADGGTLANLVDERGPLPWRDTLPYVRDIARALEQAASLSIVHRDIKPANILLAADGSAKLADLGLAKQVDAEEAGTELTMQGMSIGSPVYMAPEQVRSAKDARAPADIYGLGATWYHLLCGEPPFTGRSAAEVMSKVVREKPLPIAERIVGLPAAVVELLERMMAKEARQRPQSASEILAALETISSGSSTGFGGRESAEGVGEEGSDRKLFLIVGGVALVVIGVVAWAFLR